MSVPWKESYDKHRQGIKNQRHHFANKDTNSQSYGFSSSHIQMWELDHKEGWMSKNQCFSTVVLEKTPESPLDSKEIRQILYQLSHKGSPRILEWVTYPFSSGSSWPRDQTRVSCIAGGFFTSWAMPNVIAHVYIKVLAQTQLLKRNTWYLFLLGLKVIEDSTTRAWLSLTETTPVLVWLLVAENLSRILYLEMSLTFLYDTRVQGYEPKCNS